MDDHDKIIPLAERQQLAPVVAEALRMSPDVGQISALLDVQERWEAGQAKKAFTRALVALKGQLPSTLARDATVDFTSSRGRVSYRHTTAAAVMDAVDAHLPRHGFAVHWTTHQGDGGKISVTCRLIHEGGHSEETSLSAPPDTSGSKSPAQAIMSTVTYLRRYTAMAILGLVSGDEQEPHGPPGGEEVDPESVDAARNRRAAEYMVSAGLSLYDAEEQVGRSVDSWTAADLDTLRKWTSGRRGAQREPGEEG